MMKCVIIDDEPLAIEILENYVNRIDDFELLAKFLNPLKALDFVNENPVDLIFIDIHMPNLSGINFIKKLRVKPLFIFTTAYHQYALDAFDLEADDYLVKPISFARFLKATQKVKRLHLLQQKIKNEEFIIVRSDYKDIKINIMDIIFIESLKDYLKIHLINMEKPILTLMSFSKIMKKIQNNDFIRVHRSYVINKNYIEEIETGRLKLFKNFIPIGNTYKATVLEELKTHRS